MTRDYGSAPEAMGPLNPRWDEYMHYLYLPVWMHGNGGLQIPERLGFMAHPINWICAVEHERRGGSDWLGDHFIYITARRGYATPGNPLNRPGWHADGFGTRDINYIWSDRYPTRFAVGVFEDISDDHVRSAEQFEEQVGGQLIDVIEGAPRTLYRLDPSMIHATPEIPAPGGERSFFKVSISRDKYNLLGNSHNHRLDYEWKMWSREEIRNDPAYAGGDAGPQEVPA